MANRIPVLLFSLVLTACVSPTEPAVKSTDMKTHSCTQPRPEVCTMEYLPVCAFTTDGSKVNFSNGCSACADVGVMSWVEGGCEQ